MELGYTEKGKLRIDMRSYLEKILDDLPNKLRRSAATPVANHLFDINTDCKKLSEDVTQLFHALVAKLLFLSKRYLSDILTTISFLST